MLGFVLGVGLGLEQFFERRSGDRTRVDGVVTSRRYRQTSSAQALKETDRVRVRVRVSVGASRTTCHHKSSTNDFGTRTGLGAGG